MTTSFIAQRVKSLSNGTGYAGRFLFGFATVLAAHALAQTPAPLEIAATPAPDQPAAIVVSAHNTSRSPIRGFVIDVRYTDAAGQPLGHFTRIAMKPPLAGQPQYIAPGEVLTNKKAIPIPQDPSSHYDIVIDSVIFADGSKWGPAKLRESAKLTGLIQGADHVK